MANNQPNGNVVPGGNPGGGNQIPPPGAGQQQVPPVLNDGQNAGAAAAAAAAAGGAGAAAAGNAGGGGAGGAAAAAGAAAAGGGAAADPPPPPIILDRNGEAIPGQNEVRFNRDTQEIIWITDEKPLAPVRQSFELKFLESLTKMPGDGQENDRIKNAAAAAYRERIDTSAFELSAFEDMIKHILGEQAKSRLGQTPRTAVEIPPPKMGTKGEIPSSARKSFQFAIGNKKYYGNKRTIEEHLDLGFILGTVRDLVERHELNDAAAFTLLRPCLGGHALGQLQLYNMRSGGFQMLYLHLQSVSRSSIRREDASAQKNALKMRPIPSRGIDGVIEKIEALTRYCIDPALPELEVIPAYEQEVARDLKEVLHHHYPSAQGLIESQIEAERHLAEAELARNGGHGVPFNYLISLKRAMTAQLQVASEAHRLTHQRLPNYLTVKGRGNGNQRDGVSQADSYNGARPKRYVNAMNPNFGNGPQNVHFTNQNVQRQAPQSTGCLRCGGNHRASDCRKYRYSSEVCSKCQATGKKLFHSARDCRQGQNQRHGHQGNRNGQPGRGFGGGRGPHPPQGQQQRNQGSQGRPFNVNAVNQKNSKPQGNRGNPQNKKNNGNINTSGRGRNFRKQA